MYPIYQCRRLREEHGCDPCLLSQDMDDFTRYRTCTECVFHHPINTQSNDSESSLRIKLECLKTLFAMGDRVDRDIYRQGRGKSKQCWKDFIRT